MNISSVVKQVFGKMKLMGSDGTVIGNVGDALKISGTFSATTNEGFLDAGNSSTTPLLANATFTGSAIEIKDYSAINVAAFSDVSSATDGLKMQFSPDGINWDHQHTFSVTGNVGVSYAQAAELRYFRIVYVNGASNQTVFRLTVILKVTDVSPSRYTVGQQLQGGQMADVTKSIIWGLSSSGGGTYVATKVTPSGSLTVALGDITGVVGQNTMANSIPVAIASDQSAVPASQSGTWNITNVTGTVSLPTGASTLAAQNTGNASLSSIDGKVATETKQDSQITELQAIKGHVDGVETKLDSLISQTDGVESSLSSIDGKVATEAKQDSQITELQAIKGHVDLVETKLDTLISQTDGVESSLSSIDTKVSTATKQDTGNASLASIDAKVATEAKQDSQITELQSIKGHVDQVETKLDTLISQTDGIESSLSSIDGKVSTAAKQDTGNASLASIDGKLNSLGQKASTGSVPVVIANDQSPVPVSQSGTWNINQLSTIVNPLPTGTNDLGNVFLNGALGTKIGQVNDTLKVSIGSGTVGPAAVMGASQSPSVSDLSLVVQVSPNQDPIPTTVVPTDAISGNAQGRTPSTGTGVFTAIRQTTYTAPTTNAQRSVSSSSANDSSAGTGARQIKIYYLDQNANGPSLEEPFFTETVTLNGTTAVNTVATNICFIEKIEVVSVGSGTSNAGTITLFTGTGGTGTAIGTIAVGNLITGQGDNLTLWAHHYVPNLYLSDIYAITGGCVASAGGGNYVQQLRNRNPTLATSPELLIGDVITIAQGNAFLRTFGSSLPVFGPAIITLYGTPGTNNTTMYGSFDFADRPA
jgi:tetrahydromethanopterin S-methyltransferase subunit B